MLTKKTARNQITLPKKVVSHFIGVEYFEVTTDGTCIILHPLRKSRADEVRKRLAQLGINDQDVKAAVARVRVSKGMSGKVLPVRATSSRL
jgi:hypothetical protein